MLIAVISLVNKSGYYFERDKSDRITWLEFAIDVNFN